MKENIFEMMEYIRRQKNGRTRGDIPSHLNSKNVREPQLYQWSWAKRYLLMRKQTVQHFVSKQPIIHADLLVMHKKSTRSIESTIPK